MDNSVRAEDVLHLFDSYRKVKKGFMVSCPFHGTDSDPSLHIYDSDATGQHKLMVKCFGCDVPKSDILSFINSNGETVLDAQTLADIASGKKKSKEVKKERGTWKEAYTYRDDSGQLVFQTIRFENPKDFICRRPSTEEERDATGKDWVYSKEGINICLYNSDLISKMRAKETQTYLWKVEGESKCNLLSSLKMPSTCNPFGATSGKFLPEFAEKFQGLNVVLVPDNDLTGYNHIYEVSELVKPHVNSLKIVILPRLEKLHDDIKDWFNLYGGTKDELLQLLDAAEELKGLTLKEIKVKYPYTFIDKVAVEQDLSILDSLLVSSDSNYDETQPSVYSTKLMELLQKGRETLDREGAFVGLCESCFNSGFILSINDDSNVAVVCQSVGTMSEDSEAESISLVECNHGQFAQDPNDFNF